MIKIIKEKNALLFATPIVKQISYNFLTRIIFKSAIKLFYCALSDIFVRTGILNSLKISTLHKNTCLRIQQKNRLSCRYLLPNWFHQNYIYQIWFIQSNFTSFLLLPKFSALRWLCWYGFESPHQKNAKSYPPTRKYVWNNVLFETYVQWIALLRSMRCKQTLLLFSLIAPTSSSFSINASSLK